jgi:oxygen-dependent protoporphyrinogen oxidase
MSVLENLSNIWSEPIFEGLLGSVLVEPFKSRPEGLEDESVGSFLSRRFSTSIVDNIVSAVLHGIYAGDVYRLSAVSLLPKLWLYERSSGSILDAAFQAWTRGEQTVPINDPLFMSQIAPEMIDGQGNPLPGTEVFEDIRKSSVFTFRGGIGRLAEEIEQALEDKPNVLIKKNTPVKSIRLVSQEATSQVSVLARHKNFVTNLDQVELQSQTSGTQQESQAPEFYSHVISTISSKHLNIMTQPTDCLSPFAETHSVTVMVVNLYFSSIDLLPVHGFGYLLPRSLPFDQNPERALGVVFDSDATIGQDTGEGTKLTVMLGGHWWDNWDRYPDEEEGARMAKAVLRRHLGIKEEPEAVRVGLQRECIPQYTVGHSKRMEKAHEKLLKAFGGRLRVAGSSYTGVGLNDCVRSGFDTVMGMVSGRRLTGLEHFVGGAKWAILPKGQKLGWPKVLKT